MSFNGMKFESDGSEASAGGANNYEAAEAAVAKLGATIMDEQSGK